MVERSKRQFRYAEYYKRFSPVTVRQRPYSRMLSGLGDAEVAVPDFACFAIWEDARQQEDLVVEKIRQNFEIIGDFNVFWTDENYQSNVARLYERPYRKGPFKKYSKKVGKPPFKFIVVRDDRPVYRWAVSSSGKVEPTNLNVVNLKYEVRGFFSRDFLVHSSNNYDEFQFQAALILGIETLEELLSGAVRLQETVHKDLQGAGEWSSWEEFFATMSYCTDYLVLRNFEELPARMNEADVDFLCADYQRFASAANVLQREGKPYKGRLQVAGQSVSADIRFPGDGYYPQRWQLEMLSRRVHDGKLTIPAPDDLFFSLLYHAKVQKKDIKETYVRKLTDLADMLEFKEFAEADLVDNERMANMISGYMRSNNYYREMPTDKNVYIKREIFEKLPMLTQGQQRRFLRKLRKKFFGK